MCGIGGYVLQHPHPDSGALARVFLDTLRHRGPDEEGSRLEPSAGIVCARLSIVDIAHGQQPFVSDDGTISVVQNGEIYNFVELRSELKKSGWIFRTSSDTEVILHAYEQFGPDFVRRLNGMFAIAVLDRRERVIHLYRDRLGVKPLYLYSAAEGLFFSSEIKSFRRLPGFLPEIDPEALYLYLIYNYVPLPRTIFRNVRHVPPGTSLSISLDTLAERASPFWSIPNEPEASEPAVDEVIEKLDALFSDATRIRLRSDMPIGVFLSSGLDSSLVSAGMQKTEPAARDAYTVQFDDPLFDESSLAAELASSLGWRQTFVTLRMNELSVWPTVLAQADQPHGDVSFVALYLLSKRAAGSLKVVYTGDGGDELFGGYDRYTRLLGIPVAEAAARLENFFHEESVADERTLIPRIFSEGFLKSVSPRGGIEIFSQLRAELSAKDPINQMLYFDLKQLLPGTNLVKVDKMTMAHSIEARSPFLDYRLYEYLFTLPGELKLCGGQIRFLERKLAERYLPHATIYRPKKMLAVPIGEWFRTTWREELVQFFDDEFGWQRGYFQPEGVKALVRAHVNGEADHRRVLRALIALELWFRGLEGRPIRSVFGASDG